jgi:PIN domain nuclease of toxin-antitoxin system
MWLLNNQRMKQSAIDALDHSGDLGTPLYVSPITAWEIGNLGRRGKLHSSLPPQRWYEKLCAAPGVQFCELTPDVLLKSTFLPGNIHRDPADRIIAATAREYGFTVMTRDRALLEYGRGGYLSVLEC